MATTATSLRRPASAVSSRAATSSDLSVPAAIALAPVTAISALVLGYHPYAEDAGIYMAGVKHLLQPELFPFQPEFLTRHTDFSLFANFLAAMVRVTHLSLEWCAFLLHAVLLWAFLYGCLAVARRMFSSAAMQWGAVITIALCLGTPVAGTSLYMADPYLTARSITAPLAMFAVCAVLDRAWLRAVICIAVAAAFHPLMAIYLAAIVLSVWIARWYRMRWLFTLPLIAIAAAGGIAYWQRNTFESAAAIQAVLTRNYFFLSEWHWYETLGISLPILLLLALVRIERNNENARAIALASAVAGISSALVSLFFVHRGDNSYLLARLQVLREFQFIYFLMFLLVGAMVGRFCLRHSAWRWAAYVVVVAISLYTVQRSLYPATAQMQWPWRESQNSTNEWAQSFLWIRANTPRNAIFALDPHYTSAPGEDAIGFRATAERSALADYSKDGGAAAIFPDLAEKWQSETAAATSLDTMTDAERRAHLLPFGVTWVVLKHGAVTALDCPYSNSAALVCRLQ